MRSKVEMTSFTSEAKKEEEMAAMAMRTAQSAKVLGHLDLEKSLSPALGMLQVSKTEDKIPFKHWVFLGKPGVGKGTIASKLGAFTNLPHISTGDLIRHELNSKSGTAGELARQISASIAQGKLISDDLVLALLQKRLQQGKAVGEKGFILDGFPRNVKQALILEQLTDIDVVVNMNMRDDALVAKCLGRRTCGQCGKTFNVADVNLELEDGTKISMPKLLPPPECASKMVIRIDDNEESVKKRLRVYEEQCKDVEDFYRCQGKVMDVNVVSGVSQTWSNLLKMLHLEEKEAQATEQSFTCNKLALS